MILQATVIRSRKQYVYTYEAMDNVRTEPGFLKLSSILTPRDSQESSPTPQFKSINSSVLSFLYGLCDILSYNFQHGEMLFLVGKKPLYVVCMSMREKNITHSRNFIKSSPQNLKRNKMAIMNNPLRQRILTITYNSSGCS